LGSYQEKYMETPILIPPNWQMEFHVHTDASLLAIGVMLAQNPTNKHDQSIVYASRLLHKAKQNYTTTEWETLTIIYALHKFRHFFNVKQVCVLCRPYGFGVLGQQTTCVKKDSKMVVVILGVWVHNSLQT
jgi:hypothetical protein